MSRPKDGVKIPNSVKLSEEEKSSIVSALNVKSNKDIQKLKD